jgi:hypothetical protein
VEKEMTPAHWSRQYLISDISVGLLRKELENIRRNTIRTPDTDGSFEKVFEILDRLKGA